MAACTMWNPGARDSWMADLLGALPRETVYACECVCVSVMNDHDMGPNAMVSWTPRLPCA
eukprot:8212674-Pyramimonas_sp.AAC.1